MTRYGNILFIAGEGNGRYPFCNSLFVDDGKKAIIDPGAGKSALDDALGNTQPDFLINSHYHQDHTSCNILYPHARLFVPRKEAPCFSSIEAVLAYNGTTDPARMDLYRNALITMFHYREQTPDVLLDDGDEINCGSSVIHVIATPGHSPGHLCFFFPREEVLFLGDYDLTAFGPWYGDVTSDIDDTLASLERLKTVPARVFISGHETGVIHGDVHARIDAYRAIILQREEAIVRLLEKPRTLEDVIDHWIIYGKPCTPRWLFRQLEGTMISKHLKRLAEQERIERDGDRYVARRSP